MTWWTLLFSVMTIMCITCDPFDRWPINDQRITDLEIERELERFERAEVDKHKTAIKASGHGWNYGADGPSTWPLQYPTCEGSKQSPINIDTKNLKKKKNSISHNYDAPVSGDYLMINNGHALQINLPTKTIFRLKKDVAQFIPLQVHIHFGDADTGKGGSEHKINGYQPFAEIHMVHKNEKYGEQYAKYPDGLLVIGIFVDLIKDARNSFAPSVFSNYTNILKKAGNKISIPAFPLSWLFPQGEIIDTQYVNYQGSLTTPGCNEIVDWVVVTSSKLNINKKSAMDLLRVRNSENTKMAGNNRPVQNLNGRVVYGIN